MDKKLKVGIFMDSYYPAIDGVVVVIDNLAKELLKYCDVTIVVPFTDSYVEDENRPYKVKRVKSISVPFTEYKLGYPTNNFSRVYKELLEEEFDIIHIHSPFTIGRLGVKLAKDLGIPCFGTVHTRFDFEIRRVTDTKIIVNRIMKELMNVFNKCDKCIVVNDPLVKEIKKFGYKHKPIVMYNGTDLKPFDYRKKDLDKINKKYKLKDVDKVLLYVGRIIDIKNIYFILDALKLLKESGVSFKMLYVGSGPDSKKLLSKINKNNLSDDVIMTGRISDRKVLSAIYARADLLLFPSLMDTSSLVRIEAAVNETPGLFIKGSMTASSIVDNETGFVCDLDTSIYKEKIKSILGNKNLLKKVSVNARRTLGRSWSEVAIELFELYLKEISKR